MLSVRDLKARYGRAEVLHGLSLDIAEGQLLCLLGRNGAGKSTLLKAVMGLLGRGMATGTVAFDGLDITGRRPEAIARAGIGYVPEERRIFPGLTVAENLAVGAKPAPAGREPWTVERLLAVFPNLEGLMARPGARLSGGEQQMLAIARTLMGNPRLLLLDEPSEGLAPRIVDGLADAVLALKSAGLSILLAEQNVRFAMRISDAAVILETGQVCWQGSMAELAARPDLSKAYLQA